MELSIYIETLDPAVIFQSGGMDKVLEKIHEETSSFIPDLTSDKGRKEIAGLAHKVSKSKTLIDAYGKTLADQLNSQLKPINNERKKCRDVLDALRDSIRQPLTEWENAEKEAARLAALAEEIEGCLENAYLMNDIFDRDLVDRLAEEAAAERERVEAQEKSLDELINKIEVEVKAKVAEEYLAEKAETPITHTTTQKIKVNNLILQKFLDLGVDRLDAIVAVREMHMGQWPFVSINYSG